MPSPFYCRASSRHRATAADKSTQCIISFPPPSARNTQSVVGAELATNRVKHATISPQLARSPQPLFPEEEEEEEEEEGNTGVDAL